MTQSSVNLPLTGSGDTSAKAAVKKLSTNEVVQQIELVTAVDGGALTPIASGNPLEVAIVGTVPISGAPTTVTANLGTLNGAALDSSLQSILTKLNASIGVTGTFWQATQPVSGTFWQATQPVSGTVTANLGTIAGVATAAKQPALGTGGTPSTDVLSIQGVAGGTAIPVSGSFSGTTDLTATGSLTATNQAVSITTLNGMATCAIYISGTFSAGVTFEASVDGTNWFSIPNGNQPNTFGTLSGSVGVSNPSEWTIPVAGYAGIRARCSSFVSGTVVVAMRASAGTNTVIVGNQAAVNLALVNGSSALTGHGTASTSLRVELPTDGTGVVGLNAGANAIGSVTTELATGLTTFSNTALSNTKTAVKAGAGKVYGWMIHNPSAATTFLQVWNVAIGSITVGTTAPTYVIPIPAGASANVFSERGITHSTEINVAATTTAAGSTAPATALVCGLFYI